MKMPVAEATRRMRILAVPFRGGRRFLNLRHSPRRFQHLQECTSSPMSA
jgi:hypothetical protein